MSRVIRTRAHAELWLDLLFASMAAQAVGATGEEPDFPDVPSAMKAVIFADPHELLGWLLASHGPEDLALFLDALERRVASLGPPMQLELFPGTEGVRR